MVVDINLSQELQQNGAYTKLDFTQMKGDEFLCLFSVSTQTFYTKEMKMRDN